MLGGADNPNGELPSYITGADNVDPQPGSPCFTTARLLDRDGDIIGMDFTGHQHILAQDVIQRLQQFSNDTCPAPQRGAAQLHALATVYF